MDAALAVAQIKKIQAALQVLVMLQLTAIYWPNSMDLPSEPDAPIRYDYVIVGAGSAGCVIANRLTEDEDASVLLIEAGGDPQFETVLPGLMGYIQEGPQDWNFIEDYDKNRDIYQNNLASPLTQGKMLGGGSSANYMVHIRGNPVDFQIWADIVGDQSWNYSNVLPYFKKSECMEDPVILNSKYKKFHGTNGSLHVTRPTHIEVQEYAEMFRELGHNTLLDSNGDENLGYAEPMFTISKGIRQSTAFSFLRPIKNRYNLHILKNTFVTKVLFDDSKNAIGVQALTEDRKINVITANKEVIVTAGALNSPKLLMLSGIGPKEHLESFGIKTISNLPVGKNLQDHSAAVLAYKFKKANKPQQPPNYAEIPLPLLIGYIALKKSQKQPLYQAINFAVPNDSKGALQLSAFNFALDFDIAQAFYEAGKGREMLFTVLVLLHPNSTGTVELRSTNPEDDPRVSVGYYSDDSDLETMVRSLEDFDKLRTSSFYKSVGGEFVDLKLPKCKGFAPRSKEFWRCYALSMRTRMLHFCGTCAMGSVVDARLRVRGVKRLRVADSSAMPKITSGNTNAPVIMLAEKAADMIKQDNRNKRSIA